MDYKGIKEERKRYVRANTGRLLRRKRSWEGRKNEKKKILEEIGKIKEKMRKGVEIF